MIHTSRAAVEILQTAFIAIEGVTLSKQSLSLIADPDTIVHKSFRVTPGSVTTSRSAHCTTYFRTFRVQVFFKTSPADGEVVSVLDLMDLEDQIAEALMDLEECGTLGFDYINSDDGRLLMMSVAVPIEYTRPRA